MRHTRLLPFVLLAVLTALALAACGGGNATEAAEPEFFQPQGILTEATGSGPGVSDPFLLVANSNVLVSWTYAGEGTFMLRMRSDDPHLQGSGVENTLYIIANAPHSEEAVFTYPPGRYYVEVEQAVGDWTVAVEVTDRDPDVPTATP